MKLRKEEILWKAMKRNQKIEQVIQKKKMLEMEDEAKRQQKLDQYFEKTDKILNQRKTTPNNNVTSYRSNATYESGSDLHEEREIQVKMMTYEEKMNRAIQRRQLALEKERERIHSQYELQREKRNLAENSF